MGGLVCYGLGPRLPYVSNMPTIDKKTINNFKPGGKSGSKRGYFTDPASRGYDLRWRKVRAWYIRNNPLCSNCYANGIITPAEMVHHIRPISAGGSVADPDNLEALCNKCHALRHKQLDND